MNKFFAHLHMVNKHRFLVFKFCVRCGQFWRGLTHDLSKYSFTEFWESVKYYTGKDSPISECRKAKGYSLAWLHHKACNKHHFEYWLDPYSKKQINMPYKYAVECVCDKISATMCYKGKKNFKIEDVLAHWQKSGQFSAPTDEMREFFTQVFTDLRDFGIKKVLNKKYLKAKYKEIVGNLR